MEPFYQLLYPFYLAICWAAGVSVGYNAYADGAAAAIPGSARRDRPLFLPFFGCLYLAITSAKTIANNKMAVDVLRTRQAAERRQLFYIASFGAAIVNLNTVPAVGGLNDIGMNGFFDGVKPKIAREGKWPFGGRIITHSHQNYRPNCH